MYLNFVSLINVCLDVFLHGFILCRTVLASWTLVTVSFPMLGKFFTIFSSNIFSRPPFFFFFCVIYNSNVCVFNVIPVVSETVLICFNHFSLFFSTVVISTITSYCSFIHSSSLLILLLIPSKCDLHFSYYIVHLCLFFFSSTRSLLNISYIFSIYFSIVKTTMRQERLLNKN